MSQLRKDLKKLSDEDLEHYLELAPDESTGRKLAKQELGRRQLKVQRKNLTLGLWAAAVAIILVALVASFILRSR